MNKTVELIESINKIANVIGEENFLTSNNEIRTALLKLSKNSLLKKVYSYKTVIVETWPSKPKWSPKAQFDSPPKPKKIH